MQHEKSPNIIKSLKHFKRKNICNFESCRIQSLSGSNYQTFHFTQLSNYHDES